MRTLPLPSGCASLRIWRETCAANWLRRAGDERLPDAAIGGLGLRCDASGCIAKLRGTLVAIDARAEALAEDCARAEVVISAVATRGLCAGPNLVIDRISVARSGAHAVWLGNKTKVETVADARGIRPWSAPQYRRISPTSLP